MSPSEGTIVELSAPTPNARNVSNSEVTAFLSCRRMYKYAFVWNLMPKKVSRALDRGTLAHGAFEAYIIARLNESNHEQSMKAARQYFINETRSGNHSVDVLMEAKFLWERYMEFHQGWPEWRLLGTEERVDLKLTDTLYIAIRYDLMVEELRTGKILIGDWKTTYDFWQPEDHDLNAQLPKYIGVLRANGQRADGGFIEEIRTRSLGKEKASDHKNLWRRTFYYPPVPKVTALIRQHVTTSLEIEEFRSLPPERQKDKAIPVLNKHGACKFCNFKDLCNSENMGKKDLSTDIEIGYQENTYGYNKPEDLKKLEDII